MGPMVVLALLLGLVAFVAFVAIVHTIIGLVLTVVVALLAGLLAEGLVGEGQRNLLLTLGFGFVGAFVGTILAHISHLPTIVSVGGLPVVWTVIGAIIVVFAWHLVRPRRLSRRSTNHLRGSR